MSSRTPAEVLAQSRRRDSQAKRGKVLAVLEDMIRRGDPVSFTAVAKAAGVSHWLVYADGIRERIETARAQQNDKPRRDQQTGLSPGAASLATDLQLARAENSKLRTERDQLKAALQRQLGDQLDRLSHQSLVERVDELTQHPNRATPPDAPGQPHRPRRLRSLAAGGSSSIRPGREAIAGDRFRAGWRRI